MKFKGLLPDVGDVVILGVDYLKKGTYTVYFTDKEKIIKSITLEKK